MNNPETELNDLKQSSSFCILPWIHLSNKANGAIRMCCATSENATDLQTGKKLRWTDSNANFINSDYFRDIRTRMLNGQHVPACKRCQNEEGWGKISKRQRENTKWLKDVDSINFIKAPNKTVKFLDLRVGNLCNLACRTCNPIASSKIANMHKTLREKGYDLPDYYQKNPESNEWTNQKTFLENLKFNYQDLELIYITGGEPFIISAYKEILKEIVTLNLASRITIRFNTNGMLFNDEVISLMKNFKEVHIGLSIDGVAEYNEYIRPPSKWQIVGPNIEKLSALPKPFFVSITPTISLYNILHLPDYLRWYLNFKQRFTNVELWINFVQDPDFQKPNLLPTKLVQMVIAELDAIVSQKHCDFKKDIEALKNFLLNPPPEEEKRNQIKTFIEYDNYLNSVHGIKRPKLISEMVEDLFG